MFDLLLDRVALRATQTAHTAALGFGAAVCLIVGGLFFAVAIWVFLVQVSSTLIASMVLGALFFGAGLLLLAIMSIRSRLLRRRRYEAALRATAAREAQLATGVGGIAAIIAAFVNGMTAGKKARY